MRKKYSTYDSAGIGVIILATIFWVVYLGIKVISLPILITNICFLVTALQHGGVGTFDFTWLIWSLVGVILL